MHKFCDHPFSLTAPSILCKVIKNPSKTIFHKFYSFMFTHTQRTIPTFQQSRAQDICEWNDDFLGALWWGHWRFACDSGAMTNWNTNLMTFDIEKHFRFSIFLLFSHSLEKTLEKKSDWKCQKDKKSIGNVFGEFLWVFIAFVYYCSWRKKYAKGCKKNSFFSSNVFFTQSVSFTIEKGTRQLFSRRDKFVNKKRMQKKKLQNCTFSR